MILKKQPKVYIMDLVNAFYSSFEGLKLDDLTELAHEIAYGGMYGNKEIQAVFSWQRDKRIYA